MLRPINTLEKIYSYYNKAYYLYNLELLTKKKMKFFKNKILSVCNKLIPNQTTTTAAASVIQAPNTTDCSKSVVSCSASSYASSQRSLPLHKANSTSSGYCTVTTSDRAKHHSTTTTTTASNGSSSRYSSSINFNLENYLYDENFARIRSSALAANRASKRVIVRRFVATQSEFLDELRGQLEANVRPLGSLIDAELYLALFQNIDKVHQVGEFLKNSLLSEHEHDQDEDEDVYNSIINNIYDHVNILASSYQTYMSGYANAKRLAAQCSIELTHDLQHVIDLPVLNLYTVLSAFASLLDLTTAAHEQHEHERLRVICTHLRSVLDQLNLAEQQTCDSDLSEQQFVYDSNIDYRQRVECVDGIKYYYL